MRHMPAFLSFIFFNSYLYPRLTHITHFCLTHYSFMSLSHWCLISCLFSQSWHVSWMWSLQARVNWVSSVSLFLSLPAPLPLILSRLGFLTLTVCPLWLPPIPSHPHGIILHFTHLPRDSPVVDLTKRSLPFPLSSSPIKAISMNKTSHFMSWYVTRIKNL